MIQYSEKSTGKKASQLGEVRKTRILCPAAGNVALNNFCLYLVGLHQHTLHVKHGQSLRTRAVKTFSLDFSLSLEKAWAAQLLMHCNHPLIQHIFVSTSFPGTFQTEREKNILQRLDPRACTLLIYLSFFLSICLLNIDAAGESGAGTLENFSDWLRHAYQPPEDGRTLQVPCFDEPSLSWIHTSWLSHTRVFEGSEIETLFFEDSVLVVVHTRCMCTSCVCVPFFLFCLKLNLF